MTRRRIGLSRYVGNVIDETRDFLGDLIDRTSEDGHDLRDTSDTRSGSDRRDPDRAAGRVNREDLDRLDGKVDDLSAKLDRLLAQRSPESDKSAHA